MTLSQEASAASFSPQGVTLSTLQIQEGRENRAAMERFGHRNQEGLLLADQNCQEKGEELPLLHKGHPGQDLEVVSSTVRVSKQVKGYAKCKMMQCVLNGTPLSSGKCKGTLTKLVKTRLDRSTELIKGCSHKRRLSFKRRVIR